MKQSKFYPAIVLCSISIIVALLLSVVNMITAPRIEANLNRAADDALIEVLPEGKNFKEITLTDEYPTEVTKGWTADGGFVFQMNVTGKAENLIIMCGIDSDGKIVETKVVESGETASYVSKLFPDVEGDNGKYSGMNLDGFSEYIVAGVTMSSAAYARAVKAALQAAAIAAGGEVDIRTPEQIHQDNCNLALGTSEKTFKRWFATEILVGVQNIYVCDAGIVMVAGDRYIGVNASGNIVNSVSAEGTVSAPTDAEKATVNAAYSLYTTTKLTEIEKPAGAKKSVLKVYVTDTGNYVFDMRGSGNGINGDEWSHPSGDYIYLTVAISPDGKIIDVVTTKQTESEGYGDVCETDAYTEQFKGATAGDIVITPEHGSVGSTDLGIISGATITSNGYQTALKNAFAAFELLTAKGDN